VVIYAVNKIRCKTKQKSSTWRCPSQSTQSLTQINETGVLIPVEYWNWRCRCSKGNGDEGFARAYTGGMSSGNEGLGMRWLNVRW
jgi:hypothetical protein